MSNTECIITDSEWEDKTDLREIAAAGGRQQIVDLVTWMWSWSVSVAGGQDQARERWTKIIRNPLLWRTRFSRFARIFKHSGSDARNEYRRRALEEGAHLAVGAAETLNLAIDIFGGSRRAKEWLSEPNLYIDNRSPMEVMRTEEGVKQVKRLLQRIDYGVLT